MVAQHIALSGHGQIVSFGQEKIVRSGYTLFERHSMRIFCLDNLETGDEINYPCGRGTSCNSIARAAACVRFVTSSFDIHALT